MDTISGFSTKVLHENCTRKKIPENALNVTHVTHFSCPTPETALPANDRLPKSSISALLRALCPNNPAKRGATNGT